MLHVPQRQRPQAPSDQEQPSFAWERFANIAGELPPLFIRHWREIALNQDKILLDPNWEAYLKLDLAEILRVLTVRSDGRLVGYHFVHVFPHLHYASTLWAQSDMFWLDPDYRSGWTGYRLLKLVRDTLKENGIKVHYLPAKLHFENERIGRIVKRLGYKPIEMTYAQVL